MSEPRTTYDTRWYDLDVTCCSRCHFLQFEGHGADNHADWCNREEAEVRKPRPAAEEMKRAGVPSLFGEEGP